MGDKFSLMIRRKVTKKPLAFILFLLIFSSLNAKTREIKTSELLSDEKENANITFFTPHITWDIIYGMSVEDTTENLTAIISPDLKLTLDMKELSLDFGFKIRGSSMDFTTSSVYWPTFFNMFNVGLGSIFHINWNPAYYVETDFLIGIFFKFYPCKWFTLTHNLFYLRKDSFIYLNDSGTDTFDLSNNDMAVKTIFTFYPIKSLSLFWEFSSYSYYRYSLMMTPTFTLGIAYTFPKVFTVGFENSVQYVDLFILGANRMSVNYRLYCEMRF